MKTNKFMTILLVFMLSFSISHSLVIEENHSLTDICECVVESNHQSNLDSEHSHIFHCEFHNSYILSDNTSLFLGKKLVSASIFTIKPYIYYQTEELVKPPII